MSWSSAFRERLEGTILDFIWIVEVLPIGGTPTAGAFRLSSHPGYGDAVCIGLKGVSTGAGSRVSVSNWTSTIGEFSIVIVGDPRPAFENMTRGQQVRVLCGFPNWDEADFEPVAMGQIYNFDGAPPRWTITCRDWKSGLKSRNRPATPALFDDVNISTTLSSPYTTIDTTLTVASSAGFEKATGGTGALKVGNAFYLLWTALPTGTSITVTAADKFNTTRIASPTTSIVTCCAYLEGNPIYILRKILCSTGAGTNGVYDVLPDTWGYEIPETYTDTMDMDDWQRSLGSTLTCEVLLDEATDDGLAWMESWMRPLGLFFAMRQGRITIRAIDPLSPLAGDPYAEIADTDLVLGAPISWQAWDPEYGAEYAVVTVNTTTHDGTAVTDAISTTPGTLPAEGEFVDDLSASIWSNADAATILDETVGRLGRTKTRIPEKLRLTLPIRFAALTPGDGVRLNLTRVYGRLDDGAYVDRGALVTEVAPDWVSGRCKVTLAVFPTSEEAWVG